MRPVFSRVPATPGLPRNLCARLWRGHADRRLSRHVHEQARPQGHVPAVASGPVEHLDRDPQITVWTALDPATVANGCVQVIPGSHRAGLINPAHGAGFLTPDQAQQHAPADRAVCLTLAAGEAALLHNHLLHASDVNHTDIPRRAFSVCYMDARTGTTTQDQYPLVFPPDAPATPTGPPENIRPGQLNSCQRI